MTVRRVADEFVDMANLIGPTRAGSWLNGDGASQLSTVIMRVGTLGTNWTCDCISYTLV